MGHIKAPEAKLEMEGGGGGGRAAAGRGGGTLIFLSRRCEDTTSQIPFLRNTVMQKGRARVYGALDKSGCKCTTFELRKEE